MAKTSKFTPAQKIKLLKKTAKLSTKEAAASVGVSAQSLYKWRREAEITKVATPKVVKAATHAKAPKVKVKMAKAPSVKKVIKAVDSIQAYLNTIDGYLKAQQVA